MTDKAKLERKPFVLLIRDGWGYNPDCSQDSNNAIKCANTPYDDMLMSQYPNCLIETSGEAVGLPEGTMGNSEVGHQNIGAGRVVYQESVRLTRAIRDGSFFEAEHLKKAVQQVKEKGSKFHVMGLCSDIGVHSLLGHLYGLLELCKKNGVEEVYLHAFTDGRDSPPTSGKGYLNDIQNKMNEIGVGQIASVMGRFYAMDRDQRWDRVKEAYDCMTAGIGEKTLDVAQYMQSSYDKELTDEFIEPVNVVDENGNLKALVEDGDVVVCFNFRGDRPREITRAFVDKDFAGFDRQKNPEVYFVCMTQYDANIDAPVAFPKLPKMKNIAGSYWSELGLAQFRCAETEKYAHITFFFNDYTEDAFEGEDRQIVASPKVRTYDMKPEMSAFEVRDVVLEKLSQGCHHVYVVNFANPDMVGHTGDLEAAIAAAETVDQCVGDILEKVKSLGGAAVVLADHGNFEKMYDKDNDLPHTAHTIGKVPFIVFDEQNKDVKLCDDGTLADVIPTMLAMMKLPQPEEMTGKNLIA